MTLSKAEKEYLETLEQERDLYKSTLAKLEQDIRDMIKRFEAGKKCT